MDPASATVAFVGFTASITTLAAALFTSCKTLRNLCHDLQDAPQDLRRLFRNVQTLERMVLQVKHTGAEVGADASFAHLQTYWKVFKLQAGLNKPSPSSRHIRARFYKVFSESDIEYYEELLSRHLDVFTVLYNILSK
jgi:hypothetical protein